MNDDMTRGKPAGLLLRFALPLMLSCLLQQLYTLCDSVILGRVLGESAFAAVGAAAFLHGIPLNILLGCTQGFGVALGQRFGAKDRVGLARFFSAAGLLCLMFSLTLSLLGLCFLTPLLKLMKTPAELLPDGSRYLMVLWLGLPVTAVLTLPRLLGVTGLYLMDAAAWVLIAVYLGICYRRILKHKLATEAFHS